MIVLDANILIRAVLGRRVRQLIDTYAAKGVRFFAPDVAFDDAEKYFLPSEKTEQAPRRLFGIARILAKHHRDGYSRTLRHL